MKLTKEQLRRILYEAVVELQPSMGASKGYTQYSPAKFLEELANIDKQIMSLRSGNPFKSSGTKTPIYQIRLAINDIRTAAKLEMKNEDL